MDKKNSKVKKFKLNAKKWGIDYNKNEYYEIVESNSARPNKSFKKDSYKWCIVKITQIVALYR